MTSRLEFTTRQQDSATSARAGEIRLARGRIETPMFMPVGTVGSVKGLEPRDLVDMDARIILGNTYHLYLRPGEQVLEQMGGLHRFMAWDGPILTDSGGFQFFSLSRFARVDDDGVRFRSHLDGSRHAFTPESVIETQRVIGSDIRMVLDDCPALPAPRSRILEAMRRTTLWAQRSLQAARHLDGATFAIVQGGTDRTLRREHLDALSSLSFEGRTFEGLALGGLAVGESAAEMDEVLHEIAPRMPQDRPRYLMGVGKPGDILQAIAAGIDLFDCVLPTRNARTGQLFTREGALNLRNARHRVDDRPIDAECPCPVCATHSRAYLAHLFRSREILAPRLASIHNLRFYLDLVREARSAIIRGDYERWMNATMRRWQGTGGPDMGARTQGGSGVDPRIPV
ncbi:MAG: tRNA guanosine(34) transglycosylase Tgt [Deltaproteobacteria bacterium]|nr:MAG: tRNA guanosine(34) transglycosylase Tgt [Deltaproteobacteria bacterium]